MSGDSLSISSTMESASCLFLLSSLSDEGSLSPVPVLEAGDTSKNIGVVPTQVHCVFQAFGPR